jgi:hypothetical protein
MESAITFLSTVSVCQTCRIASGSSATNSFRTSNLPTTCSASNKAGDDSAGQCTGPNVHRVASVASAIAAVPVVMGVHATILPP